MARILVTSALPYINGVKHIGNLAGSMLPADAYARHMRQRGHETLFLCATDEHGTPAELAATEAHLPVADYCAKMYQIQKQLYEDYGLSFDWFGRSSSVQNHRLTQHFAKKLYEASLIDEVETEQIYSPADKRFLPDRYVEGTCPQCGYERARGDQCENCTRQLDPTELVEPRSAISGATDLQIRKTKHLFLRQSTMRGRLSEWIDGQKNWPKLSRSIARKWLDDGDGLRDRGITRDLQWGIQVRRGEEDWPGMEGKVFYVWFDAPLEYIAAAQEWAAETGNDWQRWWRLDEGADDVHYVQFMGKDNVPFHTLSFPATLMGSGEPWKLVDFIKGFNWLNYEGGKFSTSQRHGVFMDQALAILPADYWRWWLLSHSPESSDSNFTWEGLQTAVNRELADVLGNFVSRVGKFCAARFDNMVPQGAEMGVREASLAQEFAGLLRDYEEQMQAVQIRRAAQALRNLWSLGNEYLQESAPWAIYKSDPQAAAMVIRTGLSLARAYAILSAPFIPFASEKILSMLNLSKNTLNDWPKDTCQLLTELAPGHKITTPEPLFQKISDEQRDQWAQQFGGTGN